MKTKKVLFLPLLALCTLPPALSTAEAQGTAFTYQGRLNTNAAPANGLFDFEFSLYTNAAGSGSKIGSTVTNTAVGVTNGLFITILNFGGAFTGNATWLAISVRSNGVGSYTPLTPLQELTPTPYAITASNVSGTVPAAQLSGTLLLAQLPGAVVTNNATNVSLDNVTLSGDLSLPAPATINSGGASLLRTDGHDNFFAGQSAGNLVTTGGANTAIGFEALQFCTNDNQLVAVGYQALQNDDGTNTPGWLTVSGNGENTAVGYQALMADTFGFANTAVGYQSLNQSATGEANTALGDGTLFYNTSGICNSAVGYQTLFSNTIGCDNVGIGLQTLFCNTTGSDNTAAGWGTLFSNITGNQNVAVGYNALDLNTNDSQLVAIGCQALQDENACNQGTVSGNGENTAIGFQALMSDTTGAGNTATGYQALAQTTNGFANTALGDGALYASTSGSNNVALGYQAGINITTGNNNIDIGHQGVSGDHNIIRIGTQGTQTACYLAGTVYANGTFVSSSDRNAKENFKSVDTRDVLEKVAAMPVSRWNYKQDAASEHIGPMAQDFYAAFNVGPDDKHITTVDEGGVALAAIQGLNQKVDEKESKIQEQAAEITELQQSVAELKKLVLALAQKK